MNQAITNRVLKLLSRAEMDAIDPRLDRCLCIANKADASAIFCGVGSYGADSCFVVVYDRKDDGAAVIDTVRRIGAGRDDAIRELNEIVKATLSDFLTDPLDLDRIIRDLSSEFPIRLALKTS